MSRHRHRPRAVITSQAATADERRRDNETVRGELAIGRGSSRHNLVFGRSIGT
jgi:hypothetical protein